MEKFHYEKELLLWKEFLDKKDVFWWKKQYKGWSKTRLKGGI